MHNSDYVQDDHRILSGAWLKWIFPCASMFSFVWLGDVFKFLYPPSEGESFH